MTISVDDSTNSVYFAKILEKKNREADLVQARKRAEVNTAPYLT
jgi:hypothetical protein